MDNVEDVIKVVKPSEPILPTNTTHKRVYSKDGFPCHNPIEKERPATIKIEAPEVVYPASKRFPYGVASNFP